MSILRPPTAEILRAADLVDDAIRRWLAERTKYPPNTYWEAQSQANLMMMLTIRHVEGVLELARHDLVLLPPAISAARNAFEIAVRVLWMLTPDDPYLREIRWLAHLTEIEDLYKRLARTYSQDRELAERMYRVVATYNGFRTGVESRLPPGYSVLKRMPSLASMMEAIGEGSLYPLYTLASQYVHGTHYALELYARHLGNAREYGETVRDSEWRLPLTLSWFSIRRAGGRLLSVVQADGSIFTPQLQHSVDQALGNIGDP